MSGETIIVLPAPGDGVQRSEQGTQEIASAVQQALYKRTHPEPEQAGAFKQILAHSDSLYRYINWEDPIRTLSIFIGVQSILFGTHYLPLTQLALKAGVTTLGVVSITEFASRVLSANSLSARLRPKEYIKIPESTLNATLKDVHDFVQYAVDQAQRIVYGQDLDKTFAAFLGFTAMFWLAKLVTPFWLTVAGVTSIFVAPLVSSPRAREAAHDASVRAQELANVATEKGKVLAQNGQAKAAELSSMGKQTAANLTSKGQQTAHDLSSKTQQTASDLSSRTQQTASDLSSRTQQTASDLSSRGQQTAHDLSSRTQQTASDLSSRTQQTTADLSAQARGTASNVSESAAGGMRNMSQGVSSAYGDAKGYVSNPSSNNTYGNSDGNQSYTNGSANRGSHLSNSASENSIYPQSTTSALPAYTGEDRIDPVADTGFKYDAATHGYLNRPRGAL